MKDYPCGSASLVIVVSAVLGSIVRTDRQTDRHTYSLQTDADERYTPATFIVVSNIYASCKLKLVCFLTLSVNLDLFMFVERSMIYTRGRLCRGRPKPVRSRMHGVWLLVGVSEPFPHKLWFWRVL